MRSFSPLVSRMTPHRKTSRGVTLLELLISAIIMSSVLLAVSTLFASSRLFYYMNEDRVVISYELQYAITHIYKYTMQAMGDKNSPAITNPTPGNTSDILTFNINTSDPLTSTNYSSGMTTYTYYKDVDELKFDDGSGPISLVPQITVTDVDFTLDTNSNVLTVFLEGSYNNQTLRFYSACYPRLSSF